MNAVVKESLETIVVETAPDPSFSIVWMHGLGADGHDFEPLVPELLEPGMPAIRFVFPHAPVRPVTINNGFAMRAWYDLIGIDRRSAEDVKDVAAYVLSLSGRTHDGLRAQRGKTKFATVCAACHGQDGKGNPALGAPNLTDRIWLYGGSELAIIETINKGRKGTMPAHQELLGEAKVHLLAAYLLSLQPDAGANH